MTDHAGSQSLPTRTPAQTAIAALPPALPRHPVVADANVLFQDVMRRCKTGFGVLVDLAQLRAINLFTASHVAAKADERIPEIAVDCRIDPDVAIRVWQTVHLPLLRSVDVPSSAAAGDPRVANLKDKEDVPFAQLAILVGPSLLLTRDRHLHDVGMGTEAWAETLTVLGKLLALDAAVYGVAQTAVLGAVLRRPG